MQIAGPDGEALLRRDGEPLCVPFESWDNPDNYRKLTADEVKKLPPEKQKKVHRLKDGTLMLIEEPKQLDYRYFIKKYDLPNLYDEHGNRKR
ncbi:MAG: hypothetical protein M3Q29_09450 [Chloroflexota bacterium]|nr:hypothetical protein [Chloroflexota bacterium]